ncbi:hypothetical protein BEP19_04360 [Ammoniphilus oxalaticus]|uniref:NlpC/P60 domain-containing protein n=1 Tax=Ammoniphilus oxalaticus TaxID=66863 RepID=A0A419SLW8_9BACL|nr:NlpC/P60 family protein [Ammoniphilus oxalaticus]RKD25061.1 hypothetical protein BEP19_04360 [Ammoniphilus oxalaticus]
MKKITVLSLTLAGLLAFSSLSPAQAAAASQPIAKSAQKYIGYSLTNYTAGDFIFYTLKDSGIKSSSSLSTLYQQGKSVSTSQIKSGDIAFFGNSSKDLFAAGVYLGNNQIAIAYKPYGSVKVFSINDRIVQNNFVGLRRYAAEEVKPPKQEPSASQQREAVIKAGKKYLGTPYEYGSSRSSTKTFDCSAFTRQAYLDATGIDIGRGGATSQYQNMVKNGVSFKTDWRDLKVGDIMFFMPYRGTSKDLYEKNRSSIGHNGIYMGDGKVLHTYSKDSGGVRVDTIARHWDYRFIAGGSPLK